MATELRTIQLTEAQFSDLERILENEERIQEEDKEKGIIEEFSPILQANLHQGETNG